MITLILNIFIFLYICFVLTNLKSMFDLKIIEITKPSYIFIFLSRFLRIISSDLRFLDLKIFLSKYYLLFCNNLIISLNIFFFKLSVYNIYYTYMYNICIKIIYNFFYKIDIYFVSFFDIKYRVIARFFFYHGFKLFLILDIVKDIIFNNSLLNLSLLPWYGIYYVIITINKYTKIMKFDFDIGLHLLVTDIKCISITGLLKLREYKNFILIGSSDYTFLDYLEYKMYGLQNDNFIMFDFEKDTNL